MEVNALLTNETQLQYVQFYYVKKGDKVYFDS